MSLHQTDIELIKIQVEVLFTQDENGHLQLIRAGKSTMNTNENIEVHILEQTQDDLDAYGSVPIAFEVRSILRVNCVGTNGLGGFALNEEEVAFPWIKDYDYDEGPVRWRRWDISRWGILSAFIEDKRVGGAVVALNTLNMNFLEGRGDHAALWDLRVVPQLRGCGIGKELLERSLNWARQRSCVLMQIETQNINVPACKFYANQGCQLGTVRRFAYIDYPDEVQLIWYKSL